MPFRKKNLGHQTNSLSGGPNLTSLPLVSCVIKYKKFRNAHFGCFDDANLLVYMYESI